MTTASPESSVWISLTDKHQLLDRAEVLLYPLPAASLVSEAIAPLLGSRLAELSALGVEAIASVGSQPLGEMRVLGVGYCGLVLRVRWRGETRALKLRRLDAGCKTLVPEARSLRLANQVGVGPRCWAESENAIVMNEVRGDRLIDWVSHRLPQLSDADRATAVPAVLSKLAEDAFRLDQVGLDHGELNCAASHAIVTPTSKQATLIDFSRASRRRRMSNVTALVQGLLIGTWIPTGLSRYFALPEREEAIAKLRDYRREPSLKTFEEVRSLLQLHPL